MKRINKTKDEILKDSVEIIETKRQRVIIKEKVYPLLLTDSLNIDDAKMMCGATVAALKAAFNKQMLKQLVEDLDIKAKVADKPENERFKKLIEIFENETIYTACQLLEGIQNAIESFQREESIKRKLDTLKADLL